VSELLRVGADVELARIDPAGTPGLPNRKSVRRDPRAWTRAQMASLGLELATQQEMLYAAGKASEGKNKRRVLLVLQAMDCGGKDGTTKRVAGAMNPQGLRIVAFGPPTAEERRHDFLWRIKRALPPPGWVGVFNRSHYEDVLVARVRKLVPKKDWLARYPEINEFESELVGSGIKLVKVMLHISFEEQRIRLLARLDDPTKHWKYNPDDVDNRALWPDYQAAYQDALARCSTGHAPWYVVPADHKWYRDWAVTNLLLDAFTSLDLHYPPATFDPDYERRRLTEGVT
jgi:PPK2 family polyphosphate:nucleotide phosphotransferase